jgi:hypothetical protein
MLSAPAPVRQKLLDRVVGTKRGVSFDELGTWVQAARDQVRDERGHAPVVAEDRLDGQFGLSAGATYARVLLVVQELAEPKAVDEIRALGDLVACLQERWQRVRPRRERGRPRGSAARKSRSTNRM